MRHIVPIRENPGAATGFLIGASPVDSTIGVLATSASMRPMALPVLRFVITTRRNGNAVAESCGLRTPFNSTPLSLFALGRLSRCHFGFYCHVFNQTL